MRLLRGRVVVRESLDQTGPAWLPCTVARERTYHRGTVLQMGPPPLSRDGESEVRLDFAEGDEVLYVYVHHEGNATREWSDGQPATWIPAECVLCVVERESVRPHDWADGVLLDLLRIEP